jgi:hypothetical protein
MAVLQNKARIEISCANSPLRFWLRFIEIKVLLSAKALPAIALPPCLSGYPWRAKAQCVAIMSYDY